MWTSSSPSRRGRGRTRSAMAAPPTNPNPGGQRAHGPLSRGDRIIAALAPFLRFADHLVLRIVCRAWRRSCRITGRAPPPFPWLMLPPPPPPPPLPPPPADERGPAAPSPPPATGTPPQRRVFYDIPGGRSYAYPIPASYRHVTSRSGWLVLASPDSPRRLLLLNPVTAGQVSVPWPFGDEDPTTTTEGFHAVLTAPLGDPARCFLAVATDRLVRYCRPAAAAANVEWATLRVQGFRYDTACSDMAAVGTTVYLVNEKRKLWRADLAAAAQPKVERRDTAFELPEPEGERWRHYLVAAESLGHVLLVVSDEHHRRLGLYSLSWDTRMWVPMTSGLGGDTVLLLGRGCSAPVPASAAAGRSPGTVLVVRQPWRCGFLHADMGLNPRGGGGGGGGEQPAWFWTESRLGAGLGDEQLVVRKTVPQWPREFTGGDSFWFFPGIDVSDCP